MPETLRLQCKFIRDCRGILLFLSPSVGQRYTAHFCKACTDKPRNLYNTDHSGSRRLSSGEALKRSRLLIPCNKNSGNDFFKKNSGVGRRAAGSERHPVQTTWRHRLEETFFAAQTSSTSQKCSSGSDKIPLPIRRGQATRPSRNPSKSLPDSATGVASYPPKGERKELKEEPNDKTKC